MSSLEGFRVSVSRRIEWGEMDAMQHVNNVVYFRWFETGRAAYFDAAGLWTTGLPKGIAPILHSVGCRFKAPLFYPDDVVVGVRVIDVGADRFTVEHAVYSERLQRIAATGEGVCVSYDYDRGEKAPIPDAWRAAFARIEGRPFP